ncbi:MAG: hypothetical protein ACI31C_05285, partial [Muribaculaceae bacterium]
MTYNNDEALAKITSGAQYIESVDAVRVGTDDLGRYYLVGNISRANGVYSYGGCLVLHLKAEYRGYISSIVVDGFQAYDNYEGRVFDVMVNGILKDDMKPFDEQAYTFEVNEYAEDIIIYSCNGTICLKSIDVTITPGSDYAPAAPWYTHGNCIQMHGATLAECLMTPIVIHSAGAEHITVGINESETIYFDGNEAVIYPTEGTTYHFTAYNQYGVSRTTTVTYTLKPETGDHSYRNYGAAVTLVNSTDQLFEGCRYIMYCKDARTIMLSMNRRYTSTVPLKFANYIADHGNFMIYPAYYDVAAIMELTKDEDDNWIIGFETFDNKAGRYLAWNSQKNDAGTEYIYSFGFTFTEKADPVTINFEGDNVIIKFVDIPKAYASRQLTHNAANKLFYYNNLDQDVQLYRIDAYNISATAAATD